ncbi:unnamed protein product [Danaus chrysippus]|uniref:(African queen) hypothetical protein n=1 Tax=Danaus chrysippus TaxID=151541 RepID=A0A8J2R727_9NEOP|nr:unnamed protein product [Danaus chrysippus]
MESSELVTSHWPLRYRAPSGKDQITAKVLRKPQVSIFRFGHPTCHSVTVVRKGSRAHDGDVLNITWGVPRQSQTPGIF